MKPIRRQLENELEPRNENRDHKQEAANFECQVENTEKQHGEDEEENTENKKWKIETLTLQGLQMVKKYIQQLKLLLKMTTYRNSKQKTR